MSANVNELGSRTVNNPTAIAEGAANPAAGDTRSAALALRLETAASPRRAALERCVANRFARQYGAHIEHFLPLLFSLDIGNRPRAVAGLRSARQSRLFLEHYLDLPVEQAVSRAFRIPVDRGQIVEIGNLVSVAAGASSILFGLLAMLLDEAGVRWVTCTATPRVREMLDRLDFPSTAICVADPHALGNARSAWGSYYDSRPIVIAGDARIAAARVASNLPLGALRRSFGRAFDDIASSLQTAVS